MKNFYHGISIALLILGAIFLLNHAAFFSIVCFLFSSIFSNTSSIMALDEKLKELSKEDKNE